MSVLIVGLAVVGGLIYANNRGDKTAKASTASVNKPLKASPPTEEEKQSGNKVKSDIVTDEQQRNAASSQNTSGKKEVTPTITYAGVYGDNVEVGAFVNGIFEDGGKCTLTLQKGSTRLTATVTAVRASNNVNCPVMSLPRSSVSAGSWQVVVSYSSISAQGQSAPQTLEVQ